MVTAQEISVLAQDLYKLLGMEDLDEIEKEKFLNEFLATVPNYFFQEKVSPLLTAEEKEVLAQKFESVDKDNMSLMFSELTEKIPNLSELYVQALSEVKAKVVRDMYANKSDMYEDLIAKETDPSILEQLRSDLEKCQKNLELANSGRFDLIAAS